MSIPESVTRRRFVGHIAATGAAAAWAGQTAVSLAAEGGDEKSNHAQAPFRIGAASLVWQASPCVISLAIIFVMQLAILVRADSRPAFERSYEVC